MGNPPQAEPLRRQHQVLLAGPRAQVVVAAAVVVAAVQSFSLPNSKPLLTRSPLTSPLKWPGLPRLRQASKRPFMRCRRTRRKSLRPTRLSQRPG